MANMMCYTRNFFVILINYNEVRKSFRVRDFNYFIDAISDQLSLTQSSKLFEFFQIFCSTILMEFMSKKLIKSVPLLIKDQKLIVN